MITVVRDCTSCNPSPGSFRRDGQACTRMMAFIGGTGEQEITPDDTGQERTVSEISRAMDRSF